MKLLLLFALLFARSVCATETVVWFESDFPPIAIVNGPDKNKGAADQWGDYIRTHLPEFRHETSVANVVRLIEEMKRRNNACSNSLIKTPEREKLFLFSAPLVELLPNGFITLQSRKADLQPYLNDKGELRISDLVAAHKFRIGVATGRSFGTNIDNALQAGYNSGLIRPFSTSDIFSSGLMQMANRQSVDAVIGYAIELSYAARRLGRDPQSFLFLPIAEETSLTPIHVACSKSPQSEKIITRINEIIRAGGAEIAASAYREWLPPDTRAYYDGQRKNLARSHSNAPYLH